MLEIYIPFFLQGIWTVNVPLLDRVQSVRSGFTQIQPPSHLKQVFKTFLFSFAFPSAPNSHNPLFHERNRTASVYPYLQGPYSPVFLIVMLDHCTMWHFAIILHPILSELRKVLARTDRKKLNNNRQLTLLQCTTNQHTAVCYLSFFNCLSNCIQQNWPLVSVLRSISMHSNFIKTKPKNWSMLSWSFWENCSRETIFNWHTCWHMCLWQKGWVDIVACLLHTWWN